jgi:hypothetical protein
MEENETKKGDAKFAEGYDIGYKIGYANAENGRAFNGEVSDMWTGWVFIVFMVVMLLYLWKSSKRTKMVLEDQKTAILDQKTLLEEANKTNQLLAEISQKLDK